MTGRVLIVDDEQNVRSLLASLLESESYEVHTVPDIEGALAALEEFSPEIALLDLVLGKGEDGVALLERLKERTPALVAIMMSGKATLADAVRATRVGAFQFLEKPLTSDRVLVAVHSAEQLLKARAESRDLRSRLDEAHPLVGRSSAMEEVRALIRQVAPTPSRVLIIGESGTGKELVAWAIHDSSARSAQPLVSLNCAAIPHELVESELFGHERGAFTGAHASRRGKFELADRGTLFLDEIGELQPNAQAKLLRVLETGSFERVGGSRTIGVDVRVIAATNRDLDKATSEGTFRSDLYYRLNVFPIRVPPLREHLEDIPELVEHLASRIAAKCGRTPRRFSNGALRLLEQYRWPGNVRELANVVERLTILGGGDPVTEAAVRQVLGHDSRLRGMPEAGLERAGGLKDALAAYEIELIRRALADAQGNIADAARRLETDRANLYRRMKRLGIDRNDTPVSQ